MARFNTTPRDLTDRFSLWFAMAVFLGVGSRVALRFRANACPISRSSQTAVLAAALRLDDAVRQGGVTRDLLEETRTGLAKKIDVLGSSPHQPKPCDRFVSELVRVWARVAEIEVTVQEAARSAVEADPIMRAMLMEVTAEVVSNAVRHGGAGRVAVALRAPPDAVTLSVGGDGCGGAAEPRMRGLGSRLLDDCTLMWFQRATLNGSELTAVFPLGDGSGVQAENVNDWPGSGGGA